MSEAFEYTSPPPRELLEHYGVPEDVIDGVLSMHAHELAEKIRNSEELRDFTDDHMSDCIAAADFIDSEVDD